MEQIITALNAAYKECGYVQKAGRNKEQNYKFAGEADFIEAIRPVLLKHGIIVYPSGYDLIKAEDYSTKSGSRMNRMVGKFTFTFAHTSGQSINVVAIGEGADTSDKASPKHATIALKYALRQTLLIETGDDPDVETPEPRREPSAEDKANAALAFANGFVATLNGTDEEREALVKANFAKVKSAGNYPEARSVLEDAGIKL